MKKFLFLIAILTFSGCAVNNSDTDPDSVYIRVANSSRIDFESISVSFPGAEHTFGPVLSGRNSDYKKFEQAYRYGYIEVKTDRETYVLQPIDYVGESPLTSGKYTFKIGIQDQRVTLESTRN